MPSHFLRIEQLLEQGRTAEFPIAYSADGTAILWAEWHQKISNWTNIFSRRVEQKWALYIEDTCEFSILFFALLHSRKTILISGDTQIGTQQQLEGYVDGFVGAFDSSITDKPILKSISEELQIRATDDIIWRSLECRRTSVMVFTSGSSGEPMLLEKTLGQLSSEVQTLNDTFGGNTGNISVLSTVSHQHMYGLLFRVLWPLASGMVFGAKICTKSEEIIQNASLRESFILVSSPSHLTRLSEYLEWRETRERLLTVFSSTAPLSFNGAREIYRLLGTYPMEVYGSSETGGIAWRHQSKKNIGWKAFSGIQVRAKEDTQQIELQSPHMPTMKWSLGEDMIEIENDGEFYLRGRVDSIVKVEGKRVSLTQLEQILGKHPYVHEARVVTLNENREQTIAGVVLSEEGVLRLSDQGKNSLNQVFTSHLLYDIERVAIPKRWRYLSRFPTNQNGKTTKSILLGLFGCAKLKKRLPNIILYQSIGELSWNLMMEIPSDLDFFDGHFPRVPILPGMAIVFWVEYYARLLFQITGTFLLLRQLKFKKIIRPGQKIICSLVFEPKDSTVAFSFLSKHDAVTSGKIAFKPKA